LLIAAGSGTYLLLKNPGSKKENAIAANAKPGITEQTANTATAEKNNTNSEVIASSADHLFPGHSIIMLLILQAITTTIIKYTTAALHLQ